MYRLLKRLARAASGALLLILMFCGASAANAADAPAKPTLAASLLPPEGFEGLMESQETLADVFFGGRSIGQARITHKPGILTFADPAAIVRNLPGLRDPATVEWALTGALDAHRSLVCSPAHGLVCGKLSPPIAGVIYNEDTFRVDIFINPALLEVAPAISAGTIAAPQSGLAIASGFNAALAGRLSGSPHFDLQNRTLIGYRNARLRAETSVSSTRGVMIDQLVAEMDKGSLRYSAGLFWAPGIEFIGDSKLVGAAVSTQFDTRNDKELLRSTPLVVFLPQPAVIEIVRDGRLLASERREAGNQALDTSGYPDGSYQVELRIREAGGAVRLERRLFIKNRQMVPVGRWFLFAQAGYLTTGQDRIFPSLAKGPFLQAGAAKRISKGLGLDATFIHYRGRAMAQVGATALTTRAQVRLAALATSSGEYGALVQASSANAGILGYNFDLRRMWSDRNRALLPVSERTDISDIAGGTAFRPSSGSYTQATGNVSLRLGRAELGILASYRKDALGRSYTVGPRLDWDLVRRGGNLVSFHAEATKSDRATAAYVGVRMRFAGPRSTVSGSVGGAYLSRAAGGGQADVVGSLNGTLQRTVGSTDFELGASAERNTESNILQGLVRAVGKFGTASANFQHDLGRGTQYSASFRSGAAITTKAVAWGGRELPDSGVIVKVEGDAGKGSFEVLVDDVPRGQLRAGERLPVFLTPYREYSVRIRPVDTPRLTFDSSARQVSLYPGNIAPLLWRVEPVVTAFGRAVRPDGQAIADANVASPRGIGSTDSQGYFQIEVGASDDATITNNGETCTLKLGVGRRKDDYLPVGTVVCQ